MAVKQSRAQPIVFATHTCQLLSSPQAELLSEMDIFSSIEKDMVKETSLLSKIDLMAFRISLCVGFLKRFQQDISENCRPMKATIPSLNFHQLFETDQAAMDPITRPLPHVTSAEQCTGQAIYIEDWEIVEFNT